MAPVAAAEPIEIFGEEIGGYAVVVTADFAPLVNPNPGAPGVTVTSEAGDHTVNGVQAERQRVCVVDETLLDGTPLEGQEVVPCSETVQENVATPCEGFRQEIRERPGVGAIADDAVNDAAAAADSGVQTAVAAIESTGLVSNVEWNAATTRIATDCSGETQAVSTASAVNASELIVNINNPTICLNPSNPLLCPGVIDIDDQVRQGTERTQQGVDTFSCDFHGLVMDCTPIFVGDESVDLPLEATQEVVSMLPDEGGVFFQTEAPNATTGSAHTSDYTLRTGSIASCTVPSDPRDPDGNSEIVPFVGVGVTPSGHELPDGTLDPVEAALDSVDAAIATGAAELSAAILDIIALWTGTANPLVMSAYNTLESQVDDGWPFVDDALDGTPSEGAVQRENGSGCGATPPPAPGQPGFEPPVVPVQ